MTLAQEYVNSNNYLWNSGTFLFKQSIMMKELQTFLGCTITKEKYGFWIQRNLLVNCENA